MTTTIHLTADNFNGSPFESQALLDRPCCPNAIAKLPDDLRTIPIDESGRKILIIPCGNQRAVIINAGWI